MDDAGLPAGGIGAASREPPAAGPPALVIEHGGEWYVWVGYHGTSSAGAEAIMRDGIKARGSGQLGIGFYTTESRNAAAFWARHRALSAGGDPAVLQIYIRESAWQTMKGVRLGWDEIGMYYQPRLYDRFGYVEAPYDIGALLGEDAWQRRFNRIAVRHLLAQRG